jgi:hypothetical protein
MCEGATQYKSSGKSGEAVIYIPVRFIGETLLLLGGRRTEIHRVVDLIDM